MDEKTDSVSSPLGLSSYLKLISTFLLESSRKSSSLLSVILLESATMRIFSLKGLVGWPESASDIVLLALLLENWNWEDDAGRRLCGVSWPFLVGLRFFMISLLFFTRFLMKCSYCCRYLAFCALDSDKKLLMPKSLVFYRPSLGILPKDNSFFNVFCFCILCLLNIIIGLFELSCYGLCP